MGETFPNFLKHVLPGNVVETVFKVDLKAPLLGSGRSTSLFRVALVNTLRKSHLRKSYLGGLSEVALPEVHQVSESPTLLIRFYLYFHSLIWALGAIC